MLLTKKCNIWEIRPKIYNLSGKLANKLGEYLERSGKFQGKKHYQPCIKTTLKAIFECGYARFPERTKALYFSINLAFFAFFLALG